MRLFIALCFLLLTSCSTTKYTYQSEQNINQWKGRNIQDVVKQWGLASDTLHARDGSSYYLYNTNAGGNFFTSTTTNFGSDDFGSPQRFQHPYGGDIGLKCSTLFKTNSAGLIIDIQRTGSNCGGEWVPRSTTQKSTTSN